MNEVDLSYIIISFLLIVLILIQYIMGRSLMSEKYNREKFYILSRRRIKRLNIRNIIKISLIIFCIFIVIPIYNGYFEWYYLFLPITFIGFLLNEAIYSYPINNPELIMKIDIELDSISEEEVIVEKRNKAINNILK